MSFLESFFSKFKRRDTREVYREIIVENQIKQLQATISFLKEKFPSSYAERGFGDFDLDKFLEIYKESLSNNNLYKDYIDYMVRLIATYAVEYKLFPYDSSTPNFMQKTRTTERFLRHTLNDMANR